MSVNGRQVVDVLVVDDHDIVRLGIRRLLEDSFSVAEADSGEQAQQLIESTYDPRVVIMDIYMPGIGGLEATRRLLARYPDLRIIILTAVADGPLPRAMLVAGAQGYVTKGCSVDEMTTAIRRVRAGQKYIAPGIAQSLALSMLDGGSGPFERLSSRELQLVLLVTQGLRNNEISDTMCISPKTVSTYRTRVMQKLHISSEAELVKLALQHGLADGV